MIKGFTTGAWDLLHVGHLIFLEECKNYCDHLLVGLHLDPSKERKVKQKPVQSVYERLMQLKACKYIDSVMVYETERELETILRNSHIDIRFLGTDYDGDKSITAEDAVPIHYIDRNHDYSSTELKERIRNDKTC